MSERAVSRMAADLAVLNKQFGAEGRIVFREGRNGLPMAVLAAPHGACEVSLYGGQVLSYRPTGHAPVLFMSPSAVFEPGSPIRGGVPVCWPWFSKPPADLVQRAVTKGLGDLPIHGFARTSEWRVVKSSYAGERTELRLELLESAESLRVFPFRFLLALDVVLDKKLTLELSVRNMDAQVFTCSECLHAYFAVMDCERVVIDGVAPQSLELHSEVDTGYTVAEEGLAGVLRDEALRRTIQIEADDAGSVQVWNPWVEKSRQLSDLGDADFRKFVCVEPGNFGTHALVLEPGDTHTLTLRLSAELAQ